MPGFRGVQIGHELFNRPWRLKAGAISLKIIRKSLLASGNRKKVAVKLDSPIPIQSRVGKCTVESDAMTVALGVGQRAVHVKNQRF